MENVSLFPFVKEIPVQGDVTEIKYPGFDNE